MKLPLQIELIDFGACQGYTRTFVEKFRLLLSAAITESRADCLGISREIGYLTGKEEKVSLNRSITAEHQSFAS